MATPTVPQPAWSTDTITLLNALLAVEPDDDVGLSGSRVRSTFVPLLQMSDVPTGALVRYERLEGA